MTGRDFPKVGHSQMALIGWRSQISGFSIVRSVDGRSVQEMCVVVHLFGVTQFAIGSVSGSRADKRHATTIKFRIKRIVGRDFNGQTFRMDESLVDELSVWQATLDAL